MVQLAATPGSKNSIFLAKIFLGLSLSWAAAPAAAKGWGVGVGYHNPVGANLGVSFLYAGTTWGGEVAIGALDVGGDDDGEEAGLALGGDVDVKLFFGQSWRPYLEAGVSFGLGAGENGAGAAVGQGGLFAGGGLLLAGSSLYGLVGGDYLFEPKKVQVMGTLGLWL